MKDTHTATDIIATHLGFPDEDHAKWWKFIAPTMEYLLQAAQTEPHQQYQALLFIYRTILPALGPYPCSLNSIMGQRGNTFEPSLNFQRGGQRTVRFCFEPATHESGTPADFANIKPATRFFADLSTHALTGFDGRLFGHFAKTLFVTEDEGQMAAGILNDKPVPQSSALFAFDFKDGAILPKGYALSSMKHWVSGVPIGTRLYDSLRDLAEEMHCPTALEEIHRYVLDPMGYGIGSLVSWDYVDLSHTRLKIYNFCDTPTLDTCRHIWTCGGRWAVPGLEETMELLACLWGILEEVQVRSRGGSAEPVAHPMGWNYELTEGCEVPQTKVYMIVAGIKDVVLAEGVGRFLHSVGCVERADEPVEILHQLFPDEDVSQTTELQYFVSFTNTPQKGPYVSIYYRPVAK